jgi:hypothetical protein
MVRYKKTSTSSLYCSNCYWEFQPSKSENNDPLDVSANYLDHLNHFYGKKHSSQEPKDASSKRWQLSDLDRKLDTLDYSLIQDAYTEWTASHPSVSIASLILEPIPVRLVNKRTVRCLLDLEQNRMNLLVLPKAMPLEGDSSQLINKGKWFDKNASACTVLPVLSAVYLPSITLPYLICKLTNLTDKAMNCTFFTSSFQNANPPADYKVQRPLGGGIQYISSSSYVIAFPRSSPSSASSDSTLVISLAEYEDELLKADYTQRDRSKYFPPVPTPLGNAKGQWQSVVKDNIAYLYLPVAIEQCTDTNIAYEIHLACDLHVKESAGELELPLDIIIKVS